MGIKERLQGVFPSKEEREARINARFDEAYKKEQRAVSDFIKKRINGAEYLKLLKETRPITK